MRVDKFREVNFILPGVLWTALAGPEQFLEHFLCPKSALCVFKTNRWTNPSKQNLIKYLGQEMQEDAGVARICMGPFRREMHFSWEITKRAVFTFLFRCAGIPRRSVCNLQIHQGSMIPFLLFSLGIAELIHPTVNVSVHLFVFILSPIQWRENEEMERDLLSTFPHFLFISSLSIHFLYQKLSHFVAKC